MSYLRRAILAFALLAGITPAFAQVPAPVPALPDTERRTSYSITGTTCACAVGFALYGDSTDYANWVEVFINNTRVNFNDATFGWTITSPSGSLANLARPITDAVLTFNSVQTGTIQIVGARRPRRTSQFSENVGVPARNINQLVTDIIATQRELWDKTNDVTGRAILGPPGETVGPLPKATARAGGLLAFDGSGNPVATSPGAGTGNVTGPNSSVNSDVACWNGTTGAILKDCGAIGTTTLTGDVTGGPSVGTVAATLATVNANVGSFGSATAVPFLTVDGKGRLTAVSNVTIAPPFSALTGQATLAQLPTIGASTVLCSIGGGTPTACTTSNVLDMIGGTQGQILYRGASSWTILAPGTSGQLLQTGGAAANPSWITASGTGTLTSVATQAGITGGTITTTGTLAQDGNYSGWALQNCTLAATTNGTLLTVSLKDNAGNDPSAASPCNINYRNVTATTGSTSLVQQTAALSINTNAAGASLGSSNVTAFRFWVVSFNNAGTNVLALFNASTSATCFSLDETQVQSSTAMSGSATAAGTYYTPNGTTLSGKAIRILGYIEYNAVGLTTAGTYASGPNFIQTFGPGVRKPCEVVQSNYQSVTTLQTSSGAAFPTVASPGLTRTLNLASAANLVRVNGKTVMQTGSGGTATTGVYRSTSSFACTTAVGTASTVGSTIQGVGAFFSLDKPNNLSPIYGYCWGATTAAGTSSNADLLLDEIMG